MPLAETLTVEQVAAALNPDTLPWPGEELATLETDLWEALGKGDKDISQPEGT